MGERYDFLTPELRVELNATNVQPIVEYLAKRLGFATGERRLEFQFSNGVLRTTREGYGPIRNAELEILGRLGV